MSQADAPEGMQVIKDVLHEVECYDQKWFAQIGGYSALGQLHTLELLWRDLNSHNESMQRAAEQRNEAASTAQNAACCTCLYPLPMVIFVHSDCPVHGTPHSKRA